MEVYGLRSYEFWEFHKTLINH